MKPLFNFLLFNLLFVVALGAQTDGDANQCQDFVYLRDGSIYRGQIVEQPAEGSLVIRTWSGLILHLDQKKIRRVVQRCPEDKLLVGATLPKPYTFRERGWYNATTASILAGQTWWQSAVIGYSLHNSTGYLFRRQLGVGIGAGVDGFAPFVDGINQATYPLFAEARGYFMAKKVSPFYAVGAGWGFAGGKIGDRRGYNDDWQGGWLAKLQFGYRLGNHFTVQGGVRFQRQKRVWTSPDTSIQGYDRILHQRFELGCGILL